MPKLQKGIRACYLRGGIVSSCGCAYCENPIPEEWGEDAVCERCAGDSVQNTECRCPDCSNPMCDNCGKKKGEYVLPGEGSAMLSCKDCKDEILSYDVLARDWTSTGERCEDCLSQETTGPTFQSDFQEMNKSSFEKAWGFV